MKHYCLRVTVILMVSSLFSACASGAATTESKPPVSSSSNPDSTKSGGSSKKGNSDDNDVPATDPGYKLSRGDEIAINVFNEGDLSSAQKIDNRGIIRLPYLGEVSVAGRTVRETETYLEKALVDKKLLKQPMVTIGVRDYASREVTVLGAVNSPGKFRMPKEASSAEIVDVISGVGGFRPTGKQDDVKVTRTLDSGEEKVITVDVEAMMNPRKADRNTPRSFLIYPGDRIFVPERLF